MLLFTNTLTTMGGVLDGEGAKARVGGHKAPYLTTL